MSAFVEILRNVVEAVPGAWGAVFADWDGETVGQFAYDLPALEVQICGAQWGVVWNELQKSLARAQLGRAETLVVDWEDGSALMVRNVTDHYYVVLMLKGVTHLATAMRELDRGVATLQAEM